MFLLQLGSTLIMVIYRTEIVFSGADSYTNEVVIDFLGSLRKGNWYWALLSPFPSTRQLLAEVIFCIVWILCFRFLLEEVLILWQTKGYDITSIWHISETMGSTLWREHLKGQKLEGGLLMGHEPRFQSNCLLLIIQPS